MKLLLLHLSIFLSILFVSLPSSYSCALDDYTALVQIKKALNNPHLLSSWTSDTDCCISWTGVECNSYRYVKSLTISSGDISGHIPVQVGDLLELQTLDFSYLPHLTGNIPHSITKLKKLDLLRLKKTNLSGPIPDFISELKSLTFLDLSFNQFTGPIPSSLSKMKKLQAIQINDNKLTGSIPESFGSFVGNVPNLYLFNNKLSGKIPESLSKYDFNAVDLSGNGFVGDGSMFFGRNKTTIRVNLSRNKFQFDLSKVQFARSIVSLDLSRNRIFGKIPKELSKLHLEHFNLSYNRLCGKIPRGGLLQTFQPSVYSHNRCLCGAPLKAC